MDIYCTSSNFLVGLHLHTVQAFEWVVRDVRKLKEFVECREVPEGQEGNGSVAQNDDFEILKESPLMGDGKFKLEIGMNDSQTLCAYFEWTFSQRARHLRRTTR